MKDIKDYLHLYLNSNVSCLVDSFTTHTEPLNVANFNILCNGGYKPILRPLSSMTEEECFKLDWSYLHTSGEKIDHEPENLNPDEIIYLLSKGFDLFGLIESGLAIEKVVSPTLMKEKI
jgi:hypothetical protein